MLLKPKIYITVLFVYEIIAVMLLHCQYMCTTMLGEVACQDWFRYFAACIVIPGLVSLIWMWIETIIHARRHRFIHRARSAIVHIMDKLRETLFDDLSRDDIERYITLASIYGVRYYISKHPRLKEMLHEVIPESKKWDLWNEPSKSPKRSKRKK